MIYIELDTSNAAFENTPDEVARILEEYAKSIRSGGDLYRKFRDINGNTVGESTYTNPLKREIFSACNSLLSAMVGRNDALDTCKIVYNKLKKFVTE